MLASHDAVDGVSKGPQTRSLDNEQHHDACFASLLGEEGNGRWLIETVGEGATVTRRYRPDTLILETRIETEDGAATLIDFMPPRGKAPELVRLVRGE